MIPIESDGVKHNEIKLDDFIFRLQKGRLSIPQFQRRFVWKNRAIAELGNSIIRGYPISALLLMPKNGSLEVSDSPVGGMPMSDNDSEVLYILDGQQRSTSIAQIFHNDSSGYAWYFDMLAILNDRYPEDALMEKTATKAQFTTPFNAADLLCSLRPAGNRKNAPHESMEYGRFIWAGAAIRSFTSLVFDFISSGLNAHGEIEDADRRKYVDFLGAVLNRMRNYSICTTELHEDCSLQEVIRIFEKINTKGKQLSSSDLLSAKSFGKGPRAEEGLKQFLERELATWVVESGPVSAAVKTLFKIDPLEKKLGDPRRVTSILFTCDLLQIGFESWRWKTALMLEKPANFWYESWEKYRAQIREILEWIGTEDLHKTCPVEALQHAIAILLVAPGAFESREFRHALKLHMIKLSLNGSTLNKNNAEDIKRIHRFAMRVHESSYQEAKRTESMPHLAVNPEVLSPKGLRVSHGQGRSKRIDCLLHLMYHTQMHNFTTDLTGNKIYYDRYHDLDKHHFFPKSKFSHVEGVNSIVNFVKIDSRTNRHDFGDKRPSDYLRTLMDETPSIVSCFKDNLIPLDAALSDDVEAFFAQRSVMLSEYFIRVLSAT